MPDKPNNLDARIDSLSGEVDRLRHGRERADGHLQQVLLKVTEVQLNLASQDKLLARLECTINGGDDGKPGLTTRVDRFERTAVNLVRFGWLVIATMITAAADLAMRNWK